jgi:uncharacterized protein YabN with tetrapyrrole methylase and pyrophosphatase domain
MMRPDLAPKEMKTFSPTNATSPNSPTNCFVKVERKDSEGAVIGEIIRYDKFVELLFKVMNLGMMKAHCAMGISGEAGELADCIKKEIIYGKPLDRENLVEELGDLRFYIQATQNLYGITDQEVLQHNANKLSERYAGLAYSDEAAIVRADKNG